MFSNKIRSVLRKARLRLSSPNRWVQNTLQSTNLDGEKCYCLLGAVQCGTNLSDSETKQVISALQEAIRACGFRYGDVAEFNDSKMRKHPTILRVLDRAIAAA